MTQSATQNVLQTVRQGAPPRLTFDSVGFTYPDGTEALAHADFTVGPNEFVSVVGPSGCGKSTLLGIASGLLESTRGDCEVDRSRLGYIFQEATLLPFRTVRANVALLLELQGVGRRTRRRLVDENLELVGLSQFANHYPHRLSGGMRMRASLARSLATSPSVFLFDEPFGALDEITRERLQSELLEIFTREAFGALFITHSIPEAVFLSSRVLVMSSRPGRIVADVKIPFDYPRRHDVRYTPEFAAVTGSISQALRESSDETGP